MAHNHVIIDDDAHFSIDPKTRVISHPSPEELKLVKGDHMSERLTFDIPSLVDGHDMFGCTSIEIHCININGENTSLTSTDICAASDKRMTKDGDKDIVTFSWLVPQSVTMYAGILSFSVRFVCMDEDGATTYVWSTEPYVGLTVSDGINNNEAAMEKYYDALQGWYNNIIKAGNDSIEAIEDAKEEVIKDIDTLAKTAVDSHAEAFKKIMTADTLSVNDILVQSKGANDDRVMSQHAVTEEFNTLWNTMESSITEAVDETRAIADELREDIAKSGMQKIEPTGDVHLIEQNVKYRIYGNKTSQTAWRVRLAITHTATVDGFESERTWYHDIAANPYSEFVVFKFSIHDGKIWLTVDGFEVSETYDKNVISIRLEGATEVYVLNGGNEFTVKANGIASINRVSSNQLSDTYRISLDDGTHRDFEVRHGVGIDEVLLEEFGYGFDTYSIRLTDGHRHFFNIPNAWAYGIRKEVTGETIRVDDVSPADHKVKLSVEGEQRENSIVKVCGKNILVQPYDSATKTFRGITVTENADGSFTVNGTATHDCVWFISDQVSSGDYLKGKYTFSGINGGSATTYYAQIVVDGVYGPAIVDPTTFDFNGRLTRVGFYIKTGTTLNNVTFKLQLEKGDTATEYEPYKGRYYQANDNGVVLNAAALSPTTTVHITDGRLNVNLRMEYLQDINKVLEKAGVSEPIDAYTREETDELLLGLGREFDVKLDGVSDDIRDLDNAIGTLNDNLFDLEETGEYEDVQVATLPRDAFSLRTGTVRGDTALIEVVPSGTYVLSFESCIEHSGAASLYLNEYTEDNEQVTADKRLDFERTGTGLGSTTALIASLFPNGGRCVMTVGPTTRYIKFMFDAYAGAPERIPSGLKLVYKSPVLAYGDVKVEKLPTKVVSNNLFNKATASTGKNVYLGKNSNGEPLYGWFCSVYNVVATEASGSGFDSTSTAIEIEGGQTYFKSINTIINYFDVNDVWINAPRPDFRARSVVAPENARYVRIGFISSYLDQVQFVKGDKYLPYDEWKMGIKNFDSDKSPQIDEVLARNALHLPFMQEYMWEIAEEAHKYTAPNRHTFLFISDTHANSIGNRAMSIAANMTKYVPCSSIIHGGDIIDGMTEKKNELMLLTTLVRNGNDAKCPVYYVKGNHDWNLLYRSMINTSATRDEYILNSELARRTNGFVKNQVHGDVDSMYFYADDETTKIRTIIFNCVNKDESGDRSALDNNVQIWGAAQVEWLINEALNFKDMSDKEDWGVIVVQHQSSGSEFWKILNGFKNGTSGTTTGSDDENLSIPFDFTSQGPMNLIANFVGDIHHDGVPKVGTTPVIMIVNASLANDYADGHAPSNPDALMPADKAFGTENETAFDIVTIDKENHLIYLTRFGARSYAYNSATGKYDKIAARTRVVDYSTGTCTVITED